MRFKEFYSNKKQGVAENLNEFSLGNFGDDNDDRNDLQLYLNVALKLKMKKLKPETMRAMITRKMAELVNVVDPDKVDWAYQMLRKEQGLSNMLDQQGVSEGSDENFKSGDKVYHSGRKEIGTFLDYDDRNTTTNNNAWVDFDGEGLMVSLDRLSKAQQGVTEDTQSEDVDQITRDFIQHYENDPMGVFMHAKSSYLDAVGKAKHFSRKAAALYASHANMSKQEFQNTIMKYFGKHLQNNGFPPHASEGWGKAEHELVKDLMNLDNQGVAEDTLGEVSSNWEEKFKAEKRIADLIQSSEKWEDHSIDDINEMKKLVKIIGRATVIYDRDNYRKLGTAGGMLDLMTHYYNQKQLRSGTLPQFDSAVASSQYFARQIAMHTNGTYNHRYARVWTTSHGQRYKDPSDYVEYNSKDDLNSAWQWIESKGKKVYYYDHFKHLNEAVKIGKFIVEPASYTMRAFSDSPETVHAVSVRTAAVINKSVRRQVDISDQQANALKDIAATKNKNALEGIKLIMSILQGEQDVKSVIDNSKKLDSNVKAKLDAIIAGAANFKEPDQGVAEGEVVQPDFSKRFKPSLGGTVTKSPYYKNPDIAVPAFDKRRKSVWRDGVSNPKDREEFHHFEVDSFGRSYQITGITKSGERVQTSTTPSKELAEVLVNSYNRGGFTDVDIEKVPFSKPSKEKPNLKLVKSDNVTEQYSKSLSWSNLDEGLSVIDKMSIFEEYHHKGNLYESNEEEKKDYFLSLSGMSDSPEKNSKYIVVPISLIGNRIMLLDKPSYMKFLGNRDGSMIFRGDSGTKTYPSKTLRQLSVFNTFTFSSIETYNKFRTILFLKFDTSLPEMIIDENIQSETNKVEAYGYVYNNRDQRIVWRKIFTNEAEANQWADKRNATILGIKAIVDKNLKETSSGSVATVVNPKAKDRSKVGTLFGGTYKQRKDK